MGLILLISIVGLIWVDSNILAGTSSLTIVTPYQGEVFHYGQELVIEVQTTPNTPVSIGVVNPLGKETPSAPVESNSTGYVVVNFWTWGTIAGVNNYTGAYEVIVTAQTPSGIVTQTVTVYYEPYTATIEVTVVNEQNVPLAGATVKAYNVTNGLHEFLTSAVTNASGTAILHVYAFNFTENIEIVASYPGYVNSSATVAVKAMQTIPVTIKLYPAVVTILAVEELQNNKIIAPLNPSGYTSFTGYAGDEISILFEVLFANMKVTNATVSAMVVTPEGTVSITPTLTSSGYYNVTFMLPSINSTYEGYVEINATYSGVTNTLSVPIEVQVNFTQLIDQEINKLNAEIQTLNTTVYTLMNEIKSLNDSISSLSGELSTVSSDISTLESEITTLKTSVSSLNTTVSNLKGTVQSLSSEVNSLNSKLNSITPLVYGGLIAGIIGLIVAIVAIVLVYRKIS